MLFSKLTKPFIALVLSSPLWSLSANTNAEQYEFSPLIGYMAASDLQFSNTETLSVDDNVNVALGIAWQKSANGQGQILINATSHDYVNPVSGQNQRLDIVYAHFNGIAQFKQQGYMTTVSFGLGGAHFNGEADSVLYPSSSIALGTRYQLSTNWAFITELRAYASLVDEQDNIFCAEASCALQFDDSLWIDTTISLGLAVKF